MALQGDENRVTDQIRATAGIWRDAYTDDGLWEDDMVSVTIGGRSVLLVRSAASVRTFANLCPHKGTPLDTGCCPPRSMSTQLRSTSSSSVSLPWSSRCRRICP